MGSNVAVGDGIAVDRVVAVVAELAGGQWQWGSGFLVAGDLVVTAWHCTVDMASKGEALSVSVLRESDGQEFRVVAVTSCRPLDVAVLRLAGPAWDEQREPVRFARVPRERTGELLDCQSVGYPSFQRDGARGQRNLAEVHGTIRMADDRGSGFLLLRDGVLHDVRGGDPTSPSEPQTSAWGGLSGALVFYQGQAIGVVVEHHPRQGGSAIRIRPIDQLLTSDDPTARAVGDLLGLPETTQLPWVGAPAREPLAGLVELLEEGDLPLVSSLDPYRLGASPSVFGESGTFGVHDPYVPRTRNAVDDRLRAALEPGRLVLIVGPSKAGKTRSAFEALRERWPNARVLTPTPQGLGALADHERIARSGDPLVIWLDDLQRYVTTATPLTPAMLTALLQRPGVTIAVSTLRAEERARLRAGADELTRDTRQLLDDARPNTVELSPTSEDVHEQAAASLSYPGVDLDHAGLAEVLAGAPALLEQYHDAQYANPVLHAVIAVAIDWTRVGMPEVIPAGLLAELATQRLAATRPGYDPPTAEELSDAIQIARTPPANAGRVAALQSHDTPDGSRGYTPFSYLVAADDGQTGTPRPIPDSFWQAALGHDTANATGVGITAYYRGNIGAAIAATLLGAEAGDLSAASNMGVLLAGLDPPDVAAAREWFGEAAEAGHPDAAYNLGVLLAGLDPPDVAAASEWFRRADEAGHPDAAFNLGVLLAGLDPPDVAGAREWYGRAAEAGHPGAANNLGVLLEGLDPPELAEARKWYRLAAEAGVAPAAFSLAVLLEGMDPPELAEAAKWYRLAAEAGDAPAANNLGVLLEGLDLPEAREWYRRAAEAGYAPAAFNLGVLLEGLDPPEVEEARQWYRQAAEAGHAGAANNLGVLLEGLDPPELAEARKWYRQAAEAGHPLAALNLRALLEGLDPP